MYRNHFQKNAKRTISVVTHGTRTSRGALASESDGTSGIPLTTDAIKYITNTQYRYQPKARAHLRLLEQKTRAAPYTCALGNSASQSTTKREREEEGSAIYCLLLSGRS